MNYQYLSSFQKFLQNNQSLWYIIQNVPICIQKFDEQRDIKLAESISNNLTLSPCLHRMEYADFRHESLNYCYSSLSQMIRNGVETTTIKLDKPIISQNILHTLLTSWMQRLFELFKY